MEGRAADRLQHPPSRLRGHADAHRPDGGAGHAGSPDGAAHAGADRLQRRRTEPHAAALHRTAPCLAARHRDGEVAGHLIFYFASGGVNYEISLHAWASKVRINDGGVNQVIRAPQAGPALPLVITTLNAIVGSALAG